LPRREWQATPEVMTKYYNAHRRVGKIYHGDAVKFLKRKGIPVPPARSEYDPKNLFNQQFFNYWDSPKIEWDDVAFDIAYRRVAKAFSQ